MKFLSGAARLRGIIQLRAVVEGQELVDLALATGAQWSEHDEAGQVVPATRAVVKPPIQGYRGFLECLLQVY